MKKNILLISYFFAPQNAMGAVRLTKLAKYWSRMGHRVTVICSPGLGGQKDPILVRDLEALPSVYPVQEVNLLRTYQARKKARQGGAAIAGPGAASQAAQGRKPRKRQLLDVAYRALGQLADGSFARRAWKQAQALEGPFDVVVSSYGPISVHHVARRVKRQGLAARWIADFRDVVEMPFSWQGGYARRYARQVQREADQVVGVSQGYLDTMGLNGLEVANGYDREDLQGTQPDARRPGQPLTFVYCGQMYGSQRNLRPFFHALGAVLAAGTLRREQILLRYGGKAQDGEVFLAQARECGLEDRVENLGLLPRDEAIRLQLSGDAILVAAWNTPQCIGNLPGKLLEVLMMNRPVICCVTGSIPGSRAAQLVTETQVGYAWEEAAGAASTQGLERYVQAMAQAYLQGRSIPFTPAREAVEAYAYPQIAQGFARLFDEP